jgi:hypothetical protein
VVVVVADGGRLPGLPSLAATAGGGSSKASCSEAILEPSWPLMSVDDAGVGSSVARGIVCVAGLKVDGREGGLARGRGWRACLGF